MRNYYKFLSLLICFSFASCKSIISNPGKPLKDSYIKLNGRYEIQDYNAKVYTIRIKGIDKEHIYGTSSKGDPITIEKSSIRQMKKWNVLSSVVVGSIAIASVIFIPI